MTAPLLQVKNLRVEFNTRRGTLVAVDDVSFDIAPGEVLGVVGESGAGKSITGTAIIGLLERPGRIARIQPLRLRHVEGRSRARLGARIPGLHKKLARRGSCEARSRRRDTRPTGPD